MSIKVNNENFNFLLNLEPSMFDEKMDKARLSMEGTGPIGFVSFVLVQDSVQEKMSELLNVVELLKA